MSNEKSTVIIVGAGPAGLATAAQLSLAGIPYLILERSGQVAHSWHEHYDRLHLHTTNKLSHLAPLPFPEDYPLYVSKDQLVAYFEKYRAKFEINPIFHAEAKRIYRPEQNWIVETTTGVQYEAPHLVVATGVNHSPYVPKFPGADQFKGGISHSKTYRNAQAYIGKHVLVVGMGNTGAEIALDLAEAGAASTSIAVRDSVNIVPRDFLGNPTQITALRLAKLPNWLGDWIGIQVRRFTMGDLRKFGLKFPKIAPMAQLRATGKTPVVDLGTADMIRQGKIKIKATGIKEIQEQEVLFEDGSQQAYDHIILATGYRANLLDTIDNCASMLDEHHWPRFVIGSGSEAGLYFIGYDNYTPGGILGVINRDALRITTHISGQL